MIFLIFSLTFFASTGYVGGSLILIDDWLKRDRFLFIDWFGLLLFPWAYLIIGSSFMGTRFIFSWFTHDLASSLSQEMQLYNSISIITFKFHGSLGSPSLGSLITGFY